MAYLKHLYISSTAYFNKSQSLNVKLYQGTLIIKEPLQPGPIWINDGSFQCYQDLTTNACLLYSVWSHALVFTVNTDNILILLIFIAWCTVCFIVICICFNVVCVHQMAKCMATFLPNIGYDMVPYKGPNIRCKT